MELAPPCLLLSLLFSLVEYTLQQECDNSWQLIGGYCYQVVTKPTPYISVLEAKNNCRDHGAEIASIGSREDEVEIINFINSVSSSSKKLFIGYTDLASNNNFLWFDGLSYNYTHWDEGEPNDRNGPEPCVILDVEDEEWKDYPCCSNVGINTVLCKTGLQLANTTYSFTAMMSPEDDPVSTTRQMLHTKLEEHCGILTTPCAKLKPCLNGAACTNTDDTHYKCECAEGYAGTHCQSRINCCYPREVAHSTVVGDASHTMYGDTYIYTCHEGYQFEGGDLLETRTCTGDSSSEVGKWAPEIGHCQRIQCKMIPIMLSKSTRNKEYGTEVTYWCPNNETFKDADGEIVLNYTSTCLFNGQWIPEINDTCFERESEGESDAEKKFRTPVEAKGAEALGTVAIVFMVVEITAILLLDAPTIKDNIVFFFTNLCLCCKKEESLKKRSKYVAIKAKENGEFREVVSTFNSSKGEYETVVAPNRAPYLPEYTEKVPNGATNLQEYSKPDPDYVCVHNEQGGETRGGYPEPPPSISEDDVNVVLPKKDSIDEHDSGKRNHSSGERGEPSHDNGERSHNSGEQSHDSGERSHDESEWVDNNDFIYIDAGLNL